VTWLLAGAVLSGSGVRAAGPGSLDPARVDVCAAVPGAEVASALGARLDDARAATDPDGSFARCIYRLIPKDGAGEAAGYVLWLYRDTEFDELLAVHEGKYESVAKLGDSAILFQDQDQRWKLRFVVRGRYTAEATAPDAAGAEKLARLALGKL
jgi:hypothetical protein